MSRITLAERAAGMNWELATLKGHRLTEVLNMAQEEFPHDCQVEIDTRQENDGGPYGALNNAPHYYVVVKGADDTNPLFIKGIEDVLSAI